MLGNSEGWRNFGGLDQFRLNTNKFGIAVQKRHTESTSMSSKLKVVSPSDEAHKHVPVIAVDYVCMNEMTGETNKPMLVTHDSSSGGIWAVFTEKNGDSACEEQSRKYHQKYASEHR